MKNGAVSKYWIDIRYTGVMQANEILPIRIQTKFQSNVPENPCEHEWNLPITARNELEAYHWPQC